jgi:hypothetical protein
LLFAVATTYTVCVASVLKDVKMAALIRKHIRITVVADLVMAGWKKDE